MFKKWRNDKAQQHHEKKKKKKKPKKGVPPWVPTGPDLTETLPMELLVEIFGNLSAKDLAGHAALVCKRWFGNICRAQDAASPWKSLLLRDFGAPNKDSGGEERHSWMEVYKTYAWYPLLLCFPRTVPQLSLSPPLPFALLPHAILFHSFIFSLFLSLSPYSLPPLPSLTFISRSWSWDPKTTEKSIILSESNCRARLTTATMYNAITLSRPLTHGTHFFEVTMMHVLFLYLLALWTHSLTVGVL